MEWRIKPYRSVARALAALVISTFFVLSAAAPALAAGVELPTGSFIQSWLTDGWDEAQWAAELSAMQAVGLNTVILQSTAGANGQESGSVGAALRAASGLGMAVVIGLIEDDGWWNHGWGPPSPEWLQWADANGQKNAALAANIWARYGNEFRGTIAGFYYHNEIWNYAYFDDTLAQAIGANISAITQKLDQVAPGVPLVLSPFYNMTSSPAGPAELAQQLTTIFGYANLRSFDVLAPQDSVGVNGLASELANWLSAYQNVAISTGVQFWINHENFDTANNPADISRLISQVDATAHLAPQKRILFSWNHYYNPAHNGGQTEFNDRYLSWVAGLPNTGYSRHESLPLAPAPLNSQPRAVMPPDAVPLDSIPLETVPLDALPLDALPLDALPLDAVPLESLPLDTAAENDTSDYSAHPAAEMTGEFQARYPQPETSDESPLARLGTAIGRMIRLGLQLHNQWMW